MSLSLPTGHDLQVRLKAALLGVVGSFVLFAAYLAIPPLGIFSGILAPFPAAYNRVVHGRAAALIVILGTTAAITALFGIFSGVNLHLLISTEISGSMKQAAALYEKSGVKGEELELVKSSMTTAAELLQRLYPALVTAMLVAIAGCNLALLKKTAAKSAVNLSIGDFNTFRN